MLTRWRTLRARRRFDAVIARDRMTVRRLEIKPGDALLLSSEEPLTREQVERLKTQAAVALPAIRVIVCCGLDASVVPDARPARY